jgi:hypothetical protein
VGRVELRRLHGLCTERHLRHDRPTRFRFSGKAAVVLKIQKFLKKIVQILYTPEIFSRKVFAISIEPRHHFVFSFTSKILNNVL